MEEKVIRIYELINSKSADDDDKGNEVFNEIVRCANEEGVRIIVDFNSIELVNTAFLNNAIGKLFDRDSFKGEKYDIRIVNMEEEMIELLKETISTARERYGNM